MDSLIFWNGEFKICVSQPVKIYARINKNVLEGADILRFYGEKGVRDAIFTTYLRNVKKW